MESESTKKRRAEVELGTELDSVLGADRADLYDSINSFYQGSVQAAYEKNYDNVKAYAHLMRRIAEKSVIRVTPLAKSTHCRKCDSVILDGLSVVPPSVKAARKLKRLQEHHPSLDLTDPKHRNKLRKIGALQDAKEGATVRMRVRKGRLVRSCRSCGLVRRVPMPYAPKIAKNHKRKAEQKRKKNAH